MSIPVATQGPVWEPYLDTKQFVQERFNDRQKDSQLIQLVKQFSPNVKVTGRVEDVNYFQSIFNQVTEAVFVDTTAPEYTRMKQGEQWLNDLERHYQDADAALKSMNDVKQALEKASNPEAKHQLSRRLIDLEKEFEGIRLHLTKYKCDMIRQMISTIKQEAPSPIAKAQKELLEQLNDILKQFEEQTQQIEQISKHLIKQTIALENSFKPHPVVTRMINEYAMDQQRHIDDVKLILREFLKLPSAPDEPDKMTMIQAWEEEINALRLRCENQVEFATKLREKLGATLDDRESNYLELQIVHQQQSFEKTRAQILASKCDMIRSMNYYLIKHATNQNTIVQYRDFTKLLTEKFTKFLSEGKELSADFKGIKKEMRKWQEANLKASASLPQYEHLVMDGVVYYREVGEALEKQVEEETWHTTSWGFLLTQKSTFLNEMSEAAGMGFESSVNSLKKAKRNLKAQIEQTGDAKQKEELNKQLNGVRQVMYQTILLRIIDIVEEKRRFLKTNQNLSEDQRQIVLQDLEILDHRFGLLLRRFDEIEVSDVTFFEKLYKDITATLKSVFTLGYLNGRIMNSEELREKKHYADLGYNMLEDVQKLLNDLMAPADANTHWHDIIRKEVLNFIDWAEKHPRTAANLCGDMMLTCQIIKDESLIKQLEKTMMAKAYTSAFLRGFGTIPDQEPLVTHEQLKFKALADLSRYAPFAAGVGKGFYNVFANGSLNLVDIFFIPLREGVKGVAVQQATRLVPAEMSAMATTIIQIIRSESYQEVLDFQRNVNLVEIGGLVKQGLANPTGFFNKMKTHATEWWRLIEQSSGREKFYRVMAHAVLPAAGVTLAGGLIAVSVLGGPIGLAVALSVAVVIISSSFTLSKWLKTGLDSRYSSTVNQVQQQMRLEENQRIRREMRQKLERDPEQREQIDNQVNLYIEERVLKGALPVIEAPTHDFRAVKMDDAERKRREIESRLRQTLDQKMIEKSEVLKKQDENQEIKPFHLASIFNQSINLNELREEMLQSIQGIKYKEGEEEKELPDELRALLVEKLLSETLDNLVLNWFKLNLHTAIVNQCIDLSLKFPTKSIYETSVTGEERINPNKHLKTSLNKIHRDEDQVNLIVEQMANINSDHKNHYKKAEIARPRS